MTEAVPLGSTYELRNPPPSNRPKHTIYRFALQSAARDIVPDERVSYCLRRRRKGDEKIQLLHVKKTESSHYGNLIVCGSVWGCPVCAAKITERKRLEIQQALDIHAERGGSVAMLTMTLQHHLGEALEDVREGLKEASRRFWRGNPIQKILTRFGILGKIRGLEVTYGDNGWHPHLHIVLFFKNTQTPELMAELESWFKARWQRILQKIGRYATLEEGLKLGYGNAAIADYLAKFGNDIQAKPDSRGKWNESHEVAKSVVKRARNGGRTPNALLEDYMWGDKEAGKLWKEYYWAFKGANQIHWSRGLRDTFGLRDEKTDEEIATEQKEDADLLAEFNMEQWKQILGNDIRGELLEVARKGNAWDVLGFLEDFGIFGVYYPDLVDDPHYIGKYGGLGDIGEMIVVED